MMTSMGPQDLKRFATFICLCLTRSRSRQQKKINDTIENVQHYTADSATFRCLQAIQPAKESNE